MKKELVIGFLFPCLMTICYQAEALEWTYISDVPGSCVYCLEAHGGNIYVGTYPSGEVYRSDNGGTSWTSTGDLSGASHVMDILSASNGSLYAATHNLGSGVGTVFRSSNSGATWEQVMGDLNGADACNAVIEASSGYMYVGTGPNGDVFRTDNGGISWEVTGVLGGVSYVTSILEASDGSIYAGTSHTGQIFRTTDSGENWTECSPGEGLLDIYCMMESSDGYIYTGTSNGGQIFRTNDSGTNWDCVVDLEGPSVIIFSLIEASDGNIYAGTSYGIYKSSDGLTWEYESTGPYYEVSSLLELNGYLYAGTGIRDGILIGDFWSAQLPEPIIVDIDIKPDDYPNPINLGSLGVTPVAILSTEDFDAITVDPATIEFVGSYVAMKKKDKYMAHAEDVNFDGLPDLMLQIVTTDINPDLLVEGDGLLYAVLTGTTYDGQSIEGRDEVIIIPPEE